ncbi:NAD(P)H-binding protein [Streptomyces sp. N2-109]|uniref:NAD(P)H-binding protein n=1 Tax=Streptomyces gossypii TaxID=2883101 RepID=A0ABT2JR20_9ACTN|nr:NAD(P)H-binding protein [Streptomyces gossypii]MCT2590339.1 NAD(P)H-binding protein [Streptomyces gossypii]
MSTLALFGANGTIGLRILREALSRGHEVTAVVRDPAKLAGEDHARLTVTTGDVRDPVSVAAAASGYDVLVSAVGGGYEDGAAHATLVREATAALVEGLRSLGAEAPRLIAVGGAGSLRTADGRRVWDAEGLPELVLQVMHGQGDALDYYRTVTDVDWTSISPAATIEPGERTGTYRTALEDLVTDAQGESRISAEDYAVALVDEIEEPRHRGERFTVGY